MLSHFSHVQLFVTPWTAAHQAPLSMGFSRQEYWSGLLCPPPDRLISIPMSIHKPISRLMPEPISILTPISIYLSTDLSVGCPHSPPGGLPCWNPMPPGTAGTPIKVRQGSTLCSKLAAGQNSPGQQDSVHFLIVPWKSQWQSHTCENMLVGFRGKLGTWWIGIPHAAVNNPSSKRFQKIKLKKFF